MLYSVLYIMAPEICSYTSPTLRGRVNGEQWHVLSFKGKGKVVSVLF